MKFPTVKYHTFIFGQAPEEQFSQLVATAEDLGCQVVQTLTGVAEVSPSVMAPPGSRPQKIQIYRLVCRLPADEVEAFNQRVKELNAKAVR